MLTNPITEETLNNIAKLSPQKRKMKDVVKSKTLYNGLNQIIAIANTVLSIPYAASTQVAGALTSIFTGRYYLSKNEELRKKISMIEEDSTTTS